MADSVRVPACGAGRGGGAEEEGRVCRLRGPVLQQQGGGHPQGHLQVNCVKYYDRTPVEQILTVDLPFLCKLFEGGSSERGWGRINSLHTLISVIIIRRQRKIICSFFTCREGISFNWS